MRRAIAGSRRYLGAAALASALVFPAAAQAETYGLVVGINEYQSERMLDLQGAVNDANDIYDALTGAGATHVIRLLNREATRDGIFAAWNELISMAKPGDTIVFTYAGHGAQQPERVAGSEEDGRDEMFQLHGYQPDAAGNKERILDNEINALFAETPQFRILFVADSCHSGTMSRSFDSRAGALSVRGGGYEIIEDDQLPPPSEEAALIEEAELQHVLFFGAVKDSQLVVELPVEQQMRGVMSWAFARALRGHADANRDQVLHGRELEIFLRETVRIVSEGRQLPQMARRARSDEVAMVLPGGDVSVAQQEEPDEQQQSSGPGGAVELVHMRIIGAGNTDALMSQLADVALAEEGLAELIWDVGQGEIISASGDVVARLDRGAGPAQVQPVIDKWLLLRELAQLAGSQPLSLRFYPYARQANRSTSDDNEVSGEVHQEGTQLNFEVTGHVHEHITVFNLAMDGKVQYLIPVPDDRERAYRGEATLGESYQFPLVVQGPGPFGAEHLVTLASPAPLRDLHQQIERLNETTSARELRDILREHLSGETFQAGYVTLFSSP